MSLPINLSVSSPAQEQAMTSSRSETNASGWNPVCQNAWVKLLQPLSEYSFDEARLLCQESPNTWVAWVPDYGEVVLDKSHFYC